MRAREFADSLTEAFDRPYPLTWEKSEADDSIDALARLPDGSNLSIMFNQDLDDEGQGIYSVEFWRNNSQEVTGQGDSQRVFATVLAAIAEFIKKRQPEQLYFSANKDVEPGQKAGSRSNLYTSLVRRYATALGYEADVSDFAGSTTYKLYKLYEQKQPVAEAHMPRAIEEFLDSLNPDDCGVEVIGPYRIHFEGFTSDCKSSADYRRDPEAVYQQVYQDFIQREGGQKPVIQDMVGDERFPILYSIFRRKKLNEIGDKPQPYKPNPKRRRSLFHSEVDGNWVDVFFDRSPINGSLQITFTVNQNYEPSGPSSASRSTIRILSTVLNIIKQQLPEYIKKARPPAVTFTAKGQGRADLYRKYFVPVVQNILGPRWQLEDLPGETTLFSWRPVKRTVSESQQATARQVLNYINKTHHEPFKPGEKMYAAVMAHPQWQLKRVPLLNLNIPDQEYDDVDYDEYEPESDPYGRAMMVEPGHAGEVSQHLIDKLPIVIDADRYIIDGNHRAWAAKYLLNRDYIDAWVPV